MFIISFIESLRHTDPLLLWLYGFVVATVLAGIVTGFFKARKVQPRGFKWKQFGFEFAVAVIGGYLTGFIFRFMYAFIKAHDLMHVNPAPAAWWQVAWEYAAYFLLFDTWFYWLHRLMHKEPFYFLIHKLHHKSTSPNALTTLSVNPLESFINGGFAPLFMCVISVHQTTANLILPTNIIMGVYVHLGYEFFPRWWHKSWLTKWFITTTFHDQHHKYFNWNFGGYTTIWDRLCGTVRPKFEADFDKLADRRAGWSLRPSASPDEPLATE